MTYADWLAEQGLPVPEGSCTESAFPVFEIDAHCRDQTDGNHQESLLHDDTPHTDESRFWLRQHRCSRESGRNLPAGGACARPQQSSSGSDSIPKLSE